LEKLKSIFGGEFFLVNGRTVAVQCSVVAVAGLGVVG